MPPLKHLSTIQMNSFEEFENTRIQLEKEIEAYSSSHSAFLTKFAVFEAFNNAVEHGTYPITVKFCDEEEEEQLHITITDEGEGFPICDKLGLIEEKGIEELLQEGLFLERGRGIYMMFKTVDKVVYNEKGNEVLLVISKKSNLDFA